MYVAARRYPAFRGLRIPTKAFLLTSTTSFGAIFYAERLSNNLHSIRDPMRTYEDNSQRAVQVSRNRKGSGQRLLEWGRENRYGIVLASWVASMAIALAAVSRSPASASQKIVQARVYAQGLTLAVLIATAALEVNDVRRGESRWETVTVIDPTDPEHKRLIEKKIHKEEYQGQDLWMGKLAAFTRCQYSVLVPADQPNTDMMEKEERRLSKKAAAAAAAESRQPGHNS